MKILIFASGNIYEKEIAYAFQKANIEYTLVTTYPKFKLGEYFVKKKNIKSLLFLEVFKRTLYKLLKIINWKLINQDNFNLLINAITDYFFSFYVNKDYDLLIILSTIPWSKSIEKAKKHNVKTLYHLTVCNSQFRNNTIPAEYKKLGLENYYLNLYNSTILKTEESIKKVDFVAYVSSYQLATFVKAGFNTKNFFHLPQPTNTKIFNKEYIKLKKEKFIIIFAGNNFVRKGANYLIEAFNSLSLKNAELWMVGEDLKKFASILKLDFNKNIKFFGSLNHLVINDYYKKSSVFCLPSFEEGFPIVIPQAMTFGLPIITTQFGNDIIKNFFNGFIVDPGSTSQLAKHIKYLYDNPDKLRLMSDNAVLSHDQFLTPKNYTDTVLSKIFNVQS